MYVTARESFGLLTVRRVGECKKDCGQENFPGCSPFSILTYMEQCAIKILYVEKHGDILETDFAHKKASV